MSESRGFPAELLSFLLFGVFGVAVTAAALAGFAQLMAGQGWWVDTGRIHTDPDYIHTMLDLASSTDSDVLHECAIHLQNHVPIGSPAG